MAKTSAVTSHSTQPDSVFVCRTLEVAVETKEPPFHCEAQSAELFEVLVSIGQFQVTPDSLQVTLSRWTSTVRPVLPQLAPLLCR